MRATLCAPIIAAGLISCAGSGAPNLAPPKPSDAAAAPSSDASSAIVTPPAPDPLAAVRAHGSIVGEPLHVPSTDGKEELVAFVGRDGVTQGAFRVADGVTSPMSRWPVGVSVVSSFVVDRSAYAVVESRAVLDQPAGKHGIAAVDASPEWDPFAVEDGLIAFESVTTADAAIAILSATPTPTATAKADAKERHALLERAGKSLDALKKELPSGADLFEAYQGVFLDVREHVDGDKLAAHPAREAMLSLVRAASIGTCAAHACEATQAGSDAHLGSVVFTKAQGKWAIRGFFGATPTPPRWGASGSRALVENDKTTTSTEAVLSPRATASKLLGQASLGAQGTIGVAITDLDGLDGGDPALVIHDGPFEALLPLDEFGSSSFANPDGDKPVETYDVRFLDADGDGRTDVLVRRTSAAYGDAQPIVMTQLYFVPKSLRSSTRLQVVASVDAQMELMLGKTLDDAATSMLAFAPAAIDEKRACALLSKAKSASGLASITTKDAVVALFEEPQLPSFPRRVLPIAQTPKEFFTDVGSCKDLRCNGVSYCSREIDKPASIHYWFRRVGKELKLAGIADYAGS